MGSTSKRMVQVLSHGPDLIQFYRDNPSIAAYDLLGVDLAPIQRVIFEDMWFKPYTLAVCSRGFGKSVYTKELGYFMSKGLVYLDEVLPPIPDFLDTGEDIVVDYTGNLFTDNGYRPINKLCLEKQITGKKVITQLGLIKRGSNHHPILTIDEKCNFVYKKLEELSFGDRICIKRDQALFGSYVVPFDDAYLLGILIGVGKYSPNKFLRVETQTPLLLKFVKEYFRDHNLVLKEPLKPLNLKGRTPQVSPEPSFLKLPLSFESFLEHYMIQDNMAYAKCVPYFVRIGDQGVQKAFLKGFFDSCCTINKSNGYITCSSTSKKLFVEIQQMLLNFGIISSIYIEGDDKFAKRYILEIASEEAYNYRKTVGFRLKNLNDIIIECFKGKLPNTIHDTIPGLYAICKEAYELCMSIHSDIVEELDFTFNTKHEHEVGYSTITDLTRLLGTINTRVEDLHPKLDDIFKKLIIIRDKHYYFDTVVNVSDWVGDCYDFEMTMEPGEEPNYVTNGFINHNTFLSGVLAALLALLYPGYRVGLISASFRQSKMMFSEVEKIYAQSPILREATAKRPIRGSDTCYLQFRAVAGYNGSFIEALPLGSDGAKIRGSRFYCLLIDEFAQVPQKIIETVLAPMSITKLDPMKKVRELERRKQLIAAGLASDEDFEEDTVNKMIGTSSGYYKFNHMYKRMREYWNLIDEGSEDHAVFQVPYTLLPEGFLDEKNITNARRVMSDHEFRMEYMADMVSDSEGFFKASLLDSCTFGNDFKLEFVGDNKASYIIGIDPNQGGSAKCGLVIVKLGSDFNRLVRVMALEGKTTQDITTAIQHICDTFRIVRVFMDRGGGGKAVSDLLEEGYNGSEPILDRNKKENAKRQGRHILEVIAFNTGWISDANFATLALLEDKKLRFPEPPIKSVKDIDAIEYSLVEELKKQCTSIVVTQTSGGALHFDTPKKGQNKDLYSAFILAGYGIKALEHESDDEEESVLYATGGMLRQHNSTSWNSVSNGGNRLDATITSAALLKRK
jgi:intein/homing endonuclease